ncbi:MAG: cobalamin-binding protein, partial [Firmicutes bacterium]|nr:cobalamin-binding protein [Bacillota bacterium]
MALSKVIDSVVNADTEAVAGLIREALDGGSSPEQVLKEGLIAGMDVVGEEFESGDLFLPEMLASALTMKTGVGIL